jgi:ATP-dependent DNA helicase RecG
MKEMAEQTGLSIKGVEWNIRKLKEEGILRRVGPAKGGYWEIIEKS